MKNSTPIHWIKCQLSQFIYLHNGYAFESKYYQKHGIPLVRISNLTTTHQIVFDEMICVKDKPEYQNFVIKKGDLLLAMSGATTGKLAIYDSSIKVFQNQRVGNLKISNKNVCYDKFRNYLFFSLSNTILKLAYGGAQPNISSTKLLSLSCALPPMAEQKRIVRKIEELFGVIDRDIQRLTDTLEQLSQFRQSVLEKLLNNPVYPQISFNDGIEKIIGGSTPSKTVSAYYEGHIPFMTVKDMTSPRPQDTAWHITQEAVDNCSTHIIPANTLITATRVGLGKTVLMPFPVAINQDLKALVLNKNKVNTRFFEFILNAKTTEIISKSRGTTVKGITLEDFKSIKFYLPTLPEQQKIVDEIEKAFCSADKVQKTVQNALEEAKKLKQSILKKAFAGELVPQDPNDKPVNLPVLKGKTK